MSLPPTAYVALGANLGAREATILKALRLIEAHRAARVLRVSSLYETDPVDMGDAPRFVNAVAEVAPLLNPRDLLQRLSVIERVLGRTGGHHRSREIDLDLIAAGDDVIDTESLILPHPRYHERAFVLLPLREVAPGFRCPRTGRPVAEMAAAARGAVVRVSGRALIQRG